LESRILIVDDEKMISSVLARRLSIEGYDCLTAGNGREALSYFYKDDLSLIISDVRMPEMNGLDLLKNVKAVRPNMMFIIMNRLSGGRYGSTGHTFWESMTLSSSR